MLIKRTQFKYLLFILIFFCIYTGKSFSQNDVISINTELVTVPLTILDKQGRYVTSLKKEQFQLFENGIKQEISYFKSTSEPITVFILLDLSGSMTDYLTELANASSVFVKQLNPKDQIIVGSFANKVRIFLKKTKVSNLEKEIKIKKPYKITHTRLFDAVNTTLKKMKKIEGRKAIILFSDGDGDGVYSSYKDNIEDAEESDTLIYTIQFNTFSKKTPKHVNRERYLRAVKRAYIYMNQIASVTGGRSLQFSNISKVEKAFESIALELGQQYQIGYYPKETGEKGERRKIKVKVNVPNVAVRARKSYIVGSNKK